MFGDKFNSTFRCRFISIIENKSEIYKFDKILQQTPGSMLIHSVSFSLKEGFSKQEKMDFFLAALRLQEISHVEHFACLKQVSTKNPYDFAISMEFESEEFYQQYNNHPEHLQFMQHYWLKFIREFQEADFTSFSMEDL